MKCLLLFCRCSGVIFDIDFEFICRTKCRLEYSTSKSDDQWNLLIRIWNVLENSLLLSTFHGCGWRLVDCSFICLLWSDRKKTLLIRIRRFLMLQFENGLKCTQFFVFLRKSNNNMKKWYIRRKWHWKNYVIPHRNRLKRCGSDVAYQI